MKKYEIPAVLNGFKTKFFVCVQDGVNLYQIKLMIEGKYKNENLIICTDDIYEVVDITLC